MHKGTIKKLVRERGFGFINDTDGNEVFFHQSALIEAKFDLLNDGQEVELDTEKGPKGPRAINVRIIK